MRLYLNESDMSEEKVPGTPSKNDLKNMQKKYKKINNKHPHAKSTLERDGGAANEKGGSINNAFFNRAMGHPVDAADLSPSSTGFAADGGSAGIGAAGGDCGGGAGGEALNQAFDEMNSLVEEIYEQDEVEVTRTEIDDNFSL